jgi:hypothetical protein
MPEKIESAVTVREQSETGEKIGATDMLTFTVTRIKALDGIFNVAERNLGSMMIVVVVMIMDLRSHDTNGSYDDRSERRDEHGC